MIKNTKKNVLSTQYLKIKLNESLILNDEIIYIYIYIKKKREG
jgi:hypothetical protein